MHVQIYFQYRDQDNAGCLKAAATPLTAHTIGFSQHTLDYLHIGGILEGSCEIALGRGRVGNDGDTIKHAINHL